MTQIKNSVSQIPAMNFLGPKLTDAHYLALETYLKGFVDGGTIKKEVDFIVPIGTAKFLVSKFMYLFVSDTKTADDLAIESSIRTNIESRRTIFGGPCAPGDTDCKIPCAPDEMNRTANKCDTFTKATKPSWFFDNREEGVTRLQSNMGAPMTTLPTITRKGFLMNTCERVLDRNKAVTNALSRAGLTINSAANSTSMVELIELFLPGIPQNQDQVSSLVNVYNSAKSQGLSNTDAWRHVLVPLCISESFEIL